MNPEEWVDEYGDALYRYALSRQVDPVAAQDLVQETFLAALKSQEHFSGSDWCGWCIRLDKEVFTQEAFRDFAKDGAVLFEADFPRQKEQPAKIKQQNHVLQHRYQVRGFPTVLLLDAEGNVLARTGYQRGGAEKYVEHLRALIAKAAE